MGKWNHSRNFLVNLPLSWKFSLTIIFPLLLMGLVTTLTIEHRLNRFFQQALLDDAQAIGNSLAASTTYHLLENDPKGVRNLLASAITLKKELVYIYVTDPDHKLVAHTFSQAIPANVLYNLGVSREPGSARTITQPADQDVLEFTVPLRGGKVGEIHVGLSKAYSREPNTKIRNDVLFVTLLISLPGLGVLLLLIRLLTRPLSNLTSVADQISRGSLAVKLPTSDDEIGRLARAFNRMASELLNQQARRAEAEKTQKNSENLYRTLVDNMDLGITLISKDFEVLLANSGQGRLLNRDPASFIGKKCYEVFEKREEVCAHCPGFRAMQSGRTESAETSSILDDGSRRRVHIRAFPARDENRQISGFIEVVSDISAQQHMEEELQRIKNIETIGQLAGGLAHDFNNLLTTLIGNIELAKAATPPDNVARQRLEAAEGACDQARRLTNQLLTFAQGGVPIKKLSRLPELLSEAGHFALSGTNLHYVLNAPQNLWPVEIDPNQMTQVINNLLVNAREAMRENMAGKLFLLAENVTLEETTELPMRAGRYVKISVADEGCGIRGEDLDKIFHPYFTTKDMGARRGTGLGLAICHSIVHKHGGYIIASSAEAKGTTITIYLPAAETDLLISASAAPPPQTQTQPPELQVLLLEDEEEVAHIATSYLVSLHHHCTVAKTGKEALKLAEEALQNGRPYNLLILDLTIRGGPGGNEVLPQIRRLQPDVPAIVSSGYTGDPIMVNYRDHGFQATLPKPFNLNSVRDAINEATAPA